MAKIGGLQLLRLQAHQRVGEMIDEYEEEARGSSPIESLFETALWTYWLVSPPEYSGLKLVNSTDELSAMVELAGNNNGLYHGELGFLGARQVQLEEWRVDYLFYAWAYGGWKKSPVGWRKLIVECDGHDFHERTKEQAARDRSRDREWQTKGYTVFRFTGSELWSDPLGCIERIDDWAGRGL